MNLYQKNKKQKKKTEKILQKHPQIAAHGKPKLLDEEAVLINLQVIFRYLND